MHREARTQQDPLSALPQDKIGLTAIPDAATALATDDVWIARGHQTARWNGQRWQRYDLPRRTSAIMALAALSPRDVWGVGSLSPVCCWEPGNPAWGRAAHHPLGWDALANGGQPDGHDGALTPAYETCITVAHGVQASLLGRPRSPKR